jgi:hypothetical protein
MLVLIVVIVSVLVSSLVVFVCEGVVLYDAEILFLF